MSLRLLLLEDDDLTRNSVASALEQIGFEIVANVATVNLAIEAISTADIDVAILDLDLGPGPTGLDLAVLIANRKPLTGIVILTSSVDPRLVRSSLPKVPDTCVYVVKSSVSSIELLADAVHKARDNALSGNSQQQLNDGLDLTDIQMETLILVAQGMSNKEIAKQRFVTEKTVEYTIAKIAENLGIEQASSINQRVHLARMYFRLRGKA